MTGPVYVADPPDQRTCVALESLVAVFHGPSGMTHLLAPPAPEILDALSFGPADVALLLARLAERHEFSSDGLHEAIAARLGELETSGLVWRE